MTRRPGGRRRGPLRRSMVAQRGNNARREGSRCTRDEKARPCKWWDKAAANSRRGRLEGARARGKVVVGCQWTAEKSKVKKSLRWRRQGLCASASATRDLGLPLGLRYISSLGNDQNKNSRFFASCSTHSMPCASPLPVIALLSTSVHVCVAMSSSPSRCLRQQSALNDRCSGPTFRTSSALMASATSVLLLNTKRLAPIKRCRRQPSRRGRCAGLPLPRAVYGVLLRSRPPAVCPLRPPPALRQSASGRPRAPPPTQISVSVRSK